MSKNIWIINHYAFPYGYGFHIRQHTIAKLLKNLGYKVTVFVASYNHLKTKKIDMTNLYKIEFHDDIKYVWIKTAEYRGNGFGRIKNIFQFSKNFHSIYKSINEIPDIVWASSPHPFVIYNAINIKKNYNCKFIFEERDIWPLTLELLNGISKYNPISLCFRYLQLQAYKKSELIVTPLINLKEFLQESGFENKQVEYIPQPFIPFEAEIFDAKIPKDKFIIGYLGSVGQSNSVKNLLKSAYLLKEHKDVFFVIIGDGPQLCELQEFAKNHLLENIKFFGKLEKKNAMYALQKCHVLYKGHPDIKLYHYGLSAVKLAEYMYSGKPIIHAVHIKDDPVKLYKAGLCIAPENEEELKKAILELKNNRKFYEECTNKGKQYIEENLTEDKIQKTLKTILAQL